MQSMKFMNDTLSSINVRIKNCDASFTSKPHKCVLVDRYTMESFLFIGSPNFLGSWGRNFVGSVIRIILIDIKQMIVYRW